MSVLQRDPQDQVRVLDENGDVVGEVPDIDDETLVDMYRYMRLARHFDTRAVSLQRQGRMGTYPPLSGQEGAQIASAIALAEADWMVPSYREHGAALLRGLPLKQTLLYWMGHEKGNQMPEDANILPPAVPIASQIPHATGAAWALKLQEKADRAVMVYFGDGATSEGDFHVGLNFAGVFDTPNVFFCNNNQWAISVPRERQTRSETIAQKATAYGIDGVQVDGMDPLAVYAVTKAALEKAKNPAEGEGRPTLIEAVQYRFGAHTTADDPTVYRDDEEVEKWKAKDPIPRLEKFLRKTGRLDDEKIEAIEAEIKQQVADAIDAAESDPRPEPSDMFDYTYEERTPEIQAQYEEFEALREKVGDEGFLRE
ncbi:MULTISPECIES: pyruvate dehydrogenase (acetyl-transferring) E1 component subunit alpha [Haloferax]|uniref:Pyruvate dehydrogenase (Acetyl-transferring) E1 component subunit alpha n=1 Tax=Haloferax marinum TaxID=2666143 RepID=A0A6A8G8B5_9EURY|nr:MULTISPECIES: pyruvate dehydrogenase (acetyl-transferring) E1 component subunit alpha [Haloferax]KAB1197781.1 pyruvate dehydrogenase (acetyl-transferring) E1 component subunit alpha [Haloferax sp. CBA1150]MRW96838.1 pyruvate dehydrogenase (acetyl-transferring) E1 component subunit alpha [Haloferax marinum]